MKKSVLAMVLAFGATVSSGADVQYYKLVGLVGTLSEMAGVDCCIDGKEKKMRFPVIELETLINVVSAIPTKPEADEPPEFGVKTMHLVMSESDWAFFRQNKERKVRVMCMPFHATNGHHQTPVLCEVKGLGKPDRL